MSIDPNPQHLLRRPKKPQPKAGGPGPIVAVAGGVVIVGGAIAGFVVFGHGKTAASAPPPSATTQIATVPVSQNLIEPAAQPAAISHPARKTRATSKPNDVPSPTPTPATTPTPAPTPTASIDRSAPTTASASKSKHEAALRLAALRRQQAVQNGTTETLPAASVGSASNAGAVRAPAPAQTQVPAPTAAATDAASLYEPRVVVDARFINRVSPTYPDIAREQGAAGTAIVLATVGPTGQVISVAIAQSTGNKLLDASAMTAARSSRFAPPEIDGTPATETYRIVYTFDPNG